MTLSTYDALLAIYFLLFSVIFMLWLHIKLEAVIKNERVNRIISWLPPLTVYAFPVWLTYHLFL